MQEKLNNHTIWTTIKSLLYKHDCVIVPNFGGFVCNKENAIIDQVSHQITPPAKKIVFNQNLKTNDGLLAQNIATSSSVSYSEALRTIENFVIQVKNVLENQKQLEVNDFGTFRLNAEANFVFLPIKSNNYLYSSFGLYPLQATPAFELTKGNRKTRIIKERKGLNPRHEQKSRRAIALKLLTLLVIAVVGINSFILLNKYGALDSMQINTAGINSWFDSLFAKTTIVASDTTKNEEPIITESDYEYNTSNSVIPLDTIIASNDESIDTLVENTPTTNETIEENNSIEIIQPETVTSENTTNVEVTNTKNYHVIGGVFCNEKNARKFYNELKKRGFEAELLLNKKTNCNRVSYKKCSSKEEASALADSLRGVDNPEIWIFTSKE